MVEKELKHTSAGPMGWVGRMVLFLGCSCGFVSVAAKSVDTWHSARMSCTQHVTRFCDE